jgi:cytochrome c oxidase subunit 2
LIFFVIGTVAILGVAAAVIGAARSGTKGDLTTDAAVVGEGAARKTAIGAGALFIVLAVIGAFAFAAASTPDRSKAGITGDFEPQPLSDPSLKSPRTLKPPSGPSISINVNGQQYLWRYTYKGNVYSYQEMVVPVGVTVLLDFTSSDVVHSWWVPQLAGSYEAVPGYINRGWLRADKADVYKGYSTAPSGPNYPNMITRVRAVPAAQFETWLSNKNREINDAQSALAETRKSGKKAEQQAGQSPGTTAPAPGADTPPGGAH